MANTVTNYTVNNTIMCNPDMCWVTFPISHALSVVGVIINVVFFLPLNFWVLWLGAKQVLTKRLLASADFLIINQIAMEFIGCSSASIWPVVNLICNETLLQICYVIDNVTFFARSLFHGCICIERYLAVVHPVVYLHKKMPLYRLLFAGTVWVVSLGFTGLSFCQIITDEVYFIPIFVMLIVMIFCSLSSLHILIKPKPGGGNTKAMDQLKRKAFSVITLILLVTIFTYVPLIYISFSLENFCLMKTLWIWILMFNFFLHPVLYLIKAGKMTCFTSVKQLIFED